MTWLKLIKIAVALAVLVAIGWMTYTGFSRARWWMLVTGVVLIAAWIVFCFYFVWPGDSTSQLRRLLRSFTYQVDRARQRHRDNSKQIDEDVFKAFAKLHAEIDALFRKHRLRVPQLRRAVMRLETRERSTGTRWQPPTLMQMGYALTATDKYQRGGSLLALYKFSGEERTRAGAIVGAYTIVKEGVADTFTGKFDAKVHTPDPVDFKTTEAARERAGPAAAVARADSPPMGSTDSEHNVGYILSLLGPLSDIDSTVLTDNLRAMAALAEDPAGVHPLTMAALRGWQRSVLTERIGYLESSLPLARRALRQAPQLLAAALADLLRETGQHASALSDCLAAMTDILVPVSRHDRGSIEQLLGNFVAQVQDMQVVPAAQALDNPGIAFVDLRGAESNSAMLRRVAELLATRAPEAGVQVYRVHVFIQISAQEFQSHLRGFRELNAGEQDQAALHTLLQGINEEQLALHSVESMLPLRARDFTRPAGHNHAQELFCSVNAAGLDLEGVAAQAQYVLWTLSGRALHAPVDHSRPLLESALMISAHGAPPAAATGN